MPGLSLSVLVVAAIALIFLAIRSTDVIRSIGSSLAEFRKTGDSSDDDR